MDYKNSFCNLIKCEYSSTYHLENGHDCVRNDSNEVWCRCTYLKEDNSIDSIWTERDLEDPERKSSIDRALIEIVAALVLSKRNEKK
jgi:hypothetical protein